MSGKKLVGMVPYPHFSKETILLCVHVTEFCQDESALDKQLLICDRPDVGCDVCQDSHQPDGVTSTQMGRDNLMCPVNRTEQCGLMYCALYCVNSVTLL